MEILYSFEKPISVADLQALLAQTNWANNRTAAGIQTMLVNTRIHIGVWENDHLIGYARALTDDRFRALIEDVVVHQSKRGTGIGSEMMRKLIERLGSVEEVILLSDSKTAPFYERLGFRKIKWNCLHFPT